VRLAVAFAPHPVSRWFLRICARPFIAIDGVEHRASWSVPTVVVVPAGPHCLSAHIRYRGTPWALGARPAAIDVSPGACSTWTARNGWLNSAPFSLTPAS
jgi:hypothetical protein